MSFAARLAAARRDRSADALEELARAALAEGEEDQALSLLAGAANTARLWHWIGLLHRALDDHRAALSAFSHAARLAPGDFGIAHGHARVAFEAGIDAVPLYDRARGLGAPNGDLLIGRAGALLAAGRGEEAAAELDAILTQVPGWIAGHHQLAQLRAVLGDHAQATRSIERAIVAAPDEIAFRRCLFEIAQKREDFDRLAHHVAAARSRGLDGAGWTDYAAIAACETGADDEADRLFAALDPAALLIWRIRHALRLGRIDDALALIDRALAGDDRAAAMPYAATAWQIAGDRRAGWLYGDPRCISVADLRRELPPLDQLAERLRTLHVAYGTYLDQSVRGGTQTDGPLLSNINPLIRQTRAAIDAAVRRHIAALPPIDPEHPLFSPRRDRRIRFAGSWSVRLRDAGHHVSHVHPQGWISSALYVSLPGTDGSESGWLTLGQPEPRLGMAIPALRTIQPQPGHLVLFPSWMWHGTRPFPKGERLTIAFDVAMPR